MYIALRNILFTMKISTLGVCWYNYFVSCFISYESNRDVECDISIGIYFNSHGLFEDCMFVKRNTWKLNFQEMLRYALVKNDLVFYNIITWRISLGDDYTKRSSYWVNTCMYTCMCFFSSDYDSLLFHTNVKPLFVFSILNLN